MMEIQIKPPLQPITLLSEGAANIADIVRIEAITTGEANHIVAHEVVHVQFRHAEARFEMIQQIGGKVRRRFNKFLKLRNFPIYY